MFLGQIKNSFAYLDYQTLRPLYSALVRSHLEYALSSLCSWYQSDIETLERTKKRATKLVKSIKNRRGKIQALKLTKFGRQKTER